MTKPLREGKKIISLIKLFDNKRKEKKWILWKSMWCKSASYMRYRARMWVVMHRSFVPMAALDWCFNSWSCFLVSYLLLNTLLCIWLCVSLFLMSCVSIANVITHLLFFVCFHHYFSSRHLDSFIIAGTSSLLSLIERWMTYLDFIHHPVTWGEEESPRSREERRMGDEKSREGRRRGAQ